MSSIPVNLGTGSPETVLPEAPRDALDRLQEALEMSGANRKAALASVVGDHPTFCDGWARLAEASPEAVEAYAYARVGYHRGLDALRAAGWKGSGYVRWREVTNRGFLRALANLQARAQEIGETVEAQRCELFLLQLDPEWKGLPEGGQG